jgi:predicted dehydrogenase
MSTDDHRTSRRDFLFDSGRLVAGSALAGLAVPHVHAAADETRRLALVGCGLRGTGAIRDAFAASTRPVKLVAMADVRPTRIAFSHGLLKRRHAAQLDVPADRQFVGFDAYRHAIDALRPGDVVVLATPPVFRWLHFQYAIEKGVHVFMEKPVGVDVPTAHRMIELAKAADEKRLKVGVGLMVRHCQGRQALKAAIDEGAIGDIIMMRAYRMHGPQGSAFSTWSDRKEGMTELEFQIYRFHSFLWLSGGLFTDFYIHQIDECCWMKGAWPVRCHASGGRHYRGDAVDQNFDVYHVEYTFADGTKLFFDGRTMAGCRNEFSSVAHGSKGVATITQNSHHLGTAGRIFKGHDTTDVSQATVVYPSGEPPDPYVVEWSDLFSAIESDTAYNEVERAARADMVTSMGRFAAHTGQEISWEKYVQMDHEFAPGLADLTLDGPSPLVADAQGRYPVPQPGILKTQEYEVTGATA